MYHTSQFSTDEGCISLCLPKKEQNGTDFVHVLYSSSIQSYSHILLAMSRLLLPFNYTWEKMEMQILKMNIKYYNLSVITQKG